MPEFKLEIQKFSVVRKLMKHMSQAVNRVGRRLMGRGPQKLSLSEEYVLMWLPRKFLAAINNDAITVGYFVGAKNLTA